MKNGANGMTLIDKAAEWVYRFCFREGVTSEKRKRCIAPLPANLIRRSGRSPALHYPPYEQSNYYYAQVCLHYSFVSLDSFSFVHWWGYGTIQNFLGRIWIFCQNCLWIISLLWNFDEILFLLLDFYLQVYFKSQNLAFWIKFYWLFNL